MPFVIKSSKPFLAQRSCDTVSLRIYINFVVDAALKSKIGCSVSYVNVFFTKNTVFFKFFALEILIKGYHDYSKNSKLLLIFSLNFDLKMLNHEKKFNLMRLVTGQISCSFCQDSHLLWDSVFK